MVKEYIAAGIPQNQNLSASQVYLAQTSRHKHDPLRGYQRLRYSRQKDGVHRLIFMSLFQDLT